MYCGVKRSCASVKVEEEMPDSHYDTAVDSLGDAEASLPTYDTEFTVIESGDEACGHVPRDSAQLKIPMPSECTVSQRSLLTTLYKIAF